MSFVKVAVILLAASLGCNAQTAYTGFDDLGLPSSIFESLDVAYELNTYLPSAFDALFAELAQADDGLSASTEIHWQDLVKACLEICAAGETISEQEAKDIIAKIDTNDDDGVTKAELLSYGETGETTTFDFLAYIADAYDVIATPAGSDILDTVIDQLDSNGDGYITASDLVESGIVDNAILGSLIVNQFDRNSDGKFSTEDIVAFELNNQGESGCSGYQKECAYPDGHIMYPNQQTCNFEPCPKPPKPIPSDVDKGRKSWYDMGIPTAMVLTGTTPDEINTEESQEILKDAIREGITEQRADDTQYKDVKVTLLCATLKNDYDQASPQAACDKAGMEYDDDFHEGKGKKGGKTIDDRRRRRSLTSDAVDGGATGEHHDHGGQAPRRLARRQLGATDLVVTYTLVVYVYGEPEYADDVLVDVMGDLKAAVEEVDSFSGPLQEAMYMLGADIDQDQTLAWIASSTSYSIKRGRKRFSAAELVGIGIGFFLLGMLVLSVCFYIGFKRGSCAFVSRVRDQPPIAQSNAVEVTTLTAQQLGSIAGNNAGGGATLGNVRVVEATPVGYSPPPQVVTDSKERTGVTGSGTLITANGGNSAQKPLAPLTTRLVQLETTLGLEAGTAGASQRVQDLEAAMGLQSDPAASLPQRISALEAAVNGPGVGMV